MLRKNLDASIMRCRSYPRPQWEDCLNRGNPKYCLARPPSQLPENDAHGITHYFKIGDAACERQDRASSQRAEPPLQAKVQWRDEWAEALHGNGRIRQ